MTRDLQRAGPDRRRRFRDAGAAARSWLLALALGVTAAGPVFAQNPPPGVLQEVDIEQNLDRQIPLDLVFRDWTGAEVRLGEYFGQRPVILSLVYYECPMLCSLVLNGLVRAMRGIDFEAGQEYSVLTVSFDPAETPDLAARSRRLYLARYGRGDTAGWPFLTGGPEAVRELTDAVGFRYAWDEAGRQWAHASAIVVVTPEGRISRYFYGIDYAPRDLRFGLIEAARGAIGSPLDRILLYCFHYDPATGRYGLAIIYVIRLMGLATVAGVGGFVLLALRRERRRNAHGSRPPG